MQAYAGVTSTIITFYLEMKSGILPILQSTTISWKVCAPILHSIKQY